MPLRERRVAALLGPTNTGKTYRAIQRMLEHPTGMFGLPLRLLAREVYEKVVAATGPDQVALVTGEEKIVPSAARYFICTVEAMPLDRRVAFVAIDEIQLAGDRQRGHVFTDRLLHCRGLDQTLFLGSDTVRGLLEELVPGIEVEAAERFSTLRFDGTHRVGALPRRSALVAFSMERVYELAEAVKAARGGTAVVLGALSPRTRNAQVELYQSGEVDHLVATDAIGMGLNLDVRHVTLEAVRKYDGRRFRDLTAAEVGQIAGRAGRYKTDGTFGTLRPLELDEELVAAVEGHAFPSIRRLFWRNSQLDWTTVEDLLQSLERPPPHPCLVPVKGEDDQHVLATLQRDREVMRRVSTPADVQRLWDICQVPDFRKTLTDAHVRLLRDLAVHLLGTSGRLPDSWVGERLKRLDRVDGDIETLMGRIAWIRTWTYVTFRGDWVEGAAAWQARTRAIEDRLSDALHHALTERFVDARAVRVRMEGSAALDGDVVRVGGLPLGRLEGLELVTEPGISREGVALARKAVRECVAARVEQLAGATFELDDAHRVCWNGGVLATLTAGPDRFEPKVVLGRLPLLEGRQKDQVRVEVERWVREVVRRLVGNLRSKQAVRPELAGLLYRLERGMGTLDVREVEDVLRGLDDADRKVLARRNVRIGRHVLYVPATLKPAMVRVRARLLSIEEGRPTVRSAPPSSATAVLDVEDAPFWWAIGFPVVGRMAVRADTLEACSAAVRKAGRKGRFELPEAVVSRLGVTREQAAGFVEALGYDRVGERFVARRGGRRRRRR